MGKQGPCHHCGVTSTPLWRNGPPEKPVLCNACGSRWRTKGSLANYTPLHARVDAYDFEDYSGWRVKTMSIKNEDTKFHKRRKDDENLGNIVTSSGDISFQKASNEDPCNRSSSGSAISNSDSCVQIGSLDVSDLTGPSLSMVWDSLVPSKKRTCVNRAKQSSVEKLTRDLHTILHEHPSYFSGSSEEDLLLESDTPMVSVEIGYGSVLFRHPSAIGREEDSEASSLTAESKNSSTAKTCAEPKGVDNQYGSPQWDRTPLEKLHIFEKCGSPLLHADLKAIFNFEEFVEHLTIEEQRRLLKYLPDIDAMDHPNSTRDLFCSPHFIDDLQAFKKLLGEGVFDFTFSVNIEDHKILKRLCLTDQAKHKWVEYYNVLKKSRRPVDSHQNSVFALPRSSTNGLRFREKQNKASLGMKEKRPMCIQKEGRGVEMTGSEESCINTKILFELPSCGSSAGMDSYEFAGDSSDQDLLLDLPSCTSFPEAELLFPPFIDTCRRADD